jgi:CMD domain protein
MTQIETGAAVSADVINAFAGIETGTALHELRARRPDIARYAQGSYQALLEPADLGGVSRLERELIALRGATLTGAHTLAAHHRARLRDLGADDALVTAVEQFPGGAQVEPRLARILEHVDRLTLAPHTASRAAIEGLLAAGLTPRDIVTVAQLIAFVSFQVHLLAGLRLLGGQPAVEGARRWSGGPSSERPGFTLDAVEWLSWVETVDLADATAEQVAVLEESSPNAKSSPYYLLLVHDVDALRERSRLFKAVMYGHGGLPRADRELASVAGSRVNGCVYCASVHSRLFVQLRKSEEPMRRILDEGVETPLTGRDKAIVDYAAQLTREPNALAPEALEPLRAAGLSDLEILDVTHVVAMFAWANRLLQTLGEVVREPAS